MGKSQRYIGLELSGAKNNKTALAALEYYPKERKIFLLDTYDRIAAHDQQTGDQALLETIGEFSPGVSAMAVNVPLEIPVCISCTRKKCPMPAKCSVSEIKWMRESTRKATRSVHGTRVLEFTPYTQRPIELWVRYQVMPKLPEAARFEIDETLGGNKAPLTARMHFLKRHLVDFPVVEVWPKLSAAILSTQMGLGKRTVSTYRHLESGNHARSEILESLTKHHGIFIYERDMRKLAGSLSCFDAFICAYTALLADAGKCVKVPTGFPVASGWVQHPLLGSHR